MAWSPIRRRTASPRAPRWPVGTQADVVVGLGGGSSMDTAKAIAVEATHEGTCWDYLFDKAEPTDKTLPVIAVTTTSGTGSHVTQVAVATNTQLRTKSYLCHPLLFPKIAIVDPELVLTAPRQVTAMTGWDAFTHAFEAYVHKNCSPYVALMAREAIGLVAANLPPLLEDLSNLERRTALAWADTLAGLCIANAGVTLPHSVGHGHQRALAARRARRIAGRRLSGVHAIHIGRGDSAICRGRPNPQSGIDGRVGRRRRSTVLRGNRSAAAADRVVDGAGDAGRAGGGTRRVGGTDADAARLSEQPACGDSGGDSERAGRVPRPGVRPPSLESILPVPGMMDSKNRFASVTGLACSAAAV